MSQFWRNYKITNNKLPILIGDMPVKSYQVNEKAMKKYKREFTYVLKKMTPVRLLKNFSYMYVFSFCKVVTLYGYSRLYVY